MMFDEQDILRTTIILALLLSALCAFWQLRVALGLLLGGGIAGLALRLMIIDGAALLHRAKLGSLEPGAARRQNWRSFLKRCSLYAGALGVALYSPLLSFFATLVGLLLPRLAIIYHLLVGRIKRGT